MNWAAPPREGSLEEKHQARDRARAEYLAATRGVPRDTAECGRRWRAYLRANADYLRLKGDHRR